METTPIPPPPPRGYSGFEVDVIARLTAIQAEISSLKGKLNEDYKHLHGNGSPGLINRVSTLEQNFRWMRWIAAAIGAAIGSAVTYFSSK